MNKINRIVLVCSFAILAVLVIAGNAPAAVVENLHNIPVNTAVINPCNGETVTFSGVGHVVASVTLDGSGGFHMVEKENVHMTGSGSLGNSYEGNQEENFQRNGRVGFEQTNPLTVSVIGTGAAPNFEVHVLLHFTVNANGTVTVFFEHFTSSCRG